MISLEDPSIKKQAAWVRAQLCKLQKGYTRLAAASDKVYQLLGQGRWFSPGTPASSSTKTGRHDIAERGVKHQQFKIQIQHLLLWKAASVTMLNASGERYRNLDFPPLTDITTTSDFL